MSRDDIKVTRFDPKTGEVLRESKVPADHFKPKLPTFPRRRPVLVSRVCPRYQGLLWLSIYDLREREAEYWLAHMHALTRYEREHLANGSAAVVRPLEQEWEQGETFHVVSNVTAEIVKTEWLRHSGGVFGKDIMYRTTFKVTDFRPFFMKRVPTPPQVDRHGKSGHDQDARIDGAYTSSHSLAVPDSAEEIDDQLRRRLHPDASMAGAVRRGKLNNLERRTRLEARIGEARGKYQHRMVRYLERELQKFEQRNEAA
jgi:hypothetical protein